MKPRIVLESHNASYADPIKVAKGEFLSLTGGKTSGMVGAGSRLPQMTDTVL